MKRHLQFGALATLLATAVVLLTVAPAAISAQQKSNSEINIQNFSFAPATLTVAVGTTVTWTNRDDDVHKIVSKDDLFKSKVLDKDEAFSFTFSKAGTYPYICSIHPKMTGTVVVH